MSRKCCTECFGDHGLRDNIIPSLSDLYGICDFCKSTNVRLIEPIKLIDYFEMLISIYEIDASGDTLVSLLKTDWRLFSHEGMHDATAKDLLTEILNNGEITRQRFSISSRYSTSGISQWEKLRSELMTDNRFFLQNSLSAERISELLNHLIGKSLPKIWYRARIKNDESSYPIDQMGAPPSKLATHGRANPVGISYLYLGSESETAIAEVRPHTGDVICVANFVLNETITVVDLRDPRATVSPFILAEASAIGQLRADISFLEKMGYELTKPVLPKSAAIDYIPSQYLCELIKKSGFNGVLYNSSVSKGFNLVLFSPSLVTGVTVSEYTVRRITIDFT